MTGRTSANTAEGCVATPGQRPGAILGIDYGRKRIGLALSDELGLTARPLGILRRINRKSMVVSLREVFRKHKVRLIVVGYPLHLTGEAGDMAMEASRFATRLKKELGVRVELMDERLTSWEASQTISGQTASRKGEALDDVAAAILLQEYLNRAGSPTSIGVQREVR
jgi:putative holliday junction resolvase